jgi:hypothetical protein
MTQRVCRRCEVAWNSDDALCWMPDCREPGEMAVIPSLMRPTWPHRTWLGYTPPAFQTTAPDDVADLAELLA